jgi:hypothetical protein
MSQTQTTAKKVDQVLSDYRDAAKAAATNMEEVPVKLRPGRQMAKEQALEQLPSLYKAVTTATIPSRLVGVFASGDAAVIAKVAEFLSQNGGAVVDAGRFYQTLGEFAGAAMGDGANRCFNTVCFTRMLSSLRGTAHDFGIKLSGNPEYEEADCPTAAEVVTHVRKLTRDAYGDVFTLHGATTAIVDAVVNNNLSSKRIPVLVVNAIDDDREALAGLFARSSAFEFQPDFEVTEESVVATFKGR